MQYVPSISQIATLLADPKRSAMIWALIDGTARGADELAGLAGLSTSSASAHLSRLSSGGLLKLESRGRKRFFRLAAPEVGLAVEALACVSVGHQAQAGAGRPAPTPLSLRRARLCQDHLGGELATQLYQRLLLKDWIERGDGQLLITSAGAEGLARCGIFIEALVPRQRQALCQCSDWSEGCPHLGGALGASLMRLFQQSGWLRTTDSSHVLRVTEAGLREIGKLGA
ncbi:helix-turn-helix transcriptional regulator [Pseudomonas sp. HR96]|uniref:ArsR/SmtB family transcription factor n=1 Tax=Pseudomonas sp. HR96 TaxID=1027966 RepID=UPI002A76450A|nr:helix-turn-helix transcriptional regulator [Pseudomonas sp. HR96]WPP00521.1 helix-turn-helix transcriptional regulator [Pseudomonas sp. HR96]